MSRNAKADSFVVTTEDGSYDIVEADVLERYAINAEVDETRIKLKFYGNPFTKTHNRQMYCSDSCRWNARREQKAKYQAKRRMRIKQKILVVDEYKKYGLGSYGTSANGHRKNKFSQEYIAIQKEMKRIGLGK